MSIQFINSPWDVSGADSRNLYYDSCRATASRCEASCTPFDSTFPTTPAGYSIANPSGTTASGLGVRRCADGYCGVVEVTCGSGGAFEAPSGCTEASCTAFSTTFPTTPAGYTVADPAGTTTAGLGSVSCAFGYIGAAAIECSCSGTFSAPTGCRRQTCGDVGCTDAGDSYATSNVNQATANAHYGIIESYNTLMNPGESASIFVANTFVTPGSFVAVTMVTTGSLPYEMVRARGDAGGGMMMIAVENLDPTSSMIG